MRTILSLALSCTLFGLSGCDEGSHLPAQLENPAPDTSYETGSSWLLAVYMAADNNLDAAASRDLNEMLRARLPEHLEILVLVDRADHDDIPWVPVSGLSEHTSARWLSIDRGGLTVLEDLGELNMSSPATFRSFVDRVEAHPAERKSVVFWDHGGGTVFGVDRTASTGEAHLSAAAMARAFLRDPADATRGYRTVDIVGFDACLMASIEAVSEFAGVAPIFVGSAEIEPGPGWDYHALGDFMGSRGDALTPIELAGAMVNTYADHYGDGRRGGIKTTMSAWRTDISPLLDEYRAFVKSLKVLVQTEALHEPLLEELRRLHLETTSYDRHSGTPANDTPHVDLGELLVNFEREEQSEEVVASANALHRELLLHRLYHRADGRDPQVSGLSVFFPLPKVPAPDGVTGGDERALYAEQSTVWAALGWSELIDSLHDTEDGSPLATLMATTGTAPTISAAASSPAVGVVSVDVQVEGAVAVGEVEHLLLREVSSGRFLAIEDIDTVLSGRGPLLDSVAFNLVAHGLGPSAAAVAESNLGLIHSDAERRSMPVALDDGAEVVEGMLLLDESDVILGLLTVGEAGAWAHHDWSEILTHAWRIAPVTYEHDLGDDPLHVLASEGFSPVRGAWVDVADATVLAEPVTKDELFVVVSASDLSGEVTVTSLDLDLEL